MSTNNQFFQDFQDKISSQLEQQQQLLLDEQLKAKSFFEELKEESVTNLQNAKDNVQKYLNELNSFNQNFQEHFKNQPFDFQSFSNVISNYQKKQLEILSETANLQKQKLTNLQNKILSFYNNSKNNSNLKEEVTNEVDTPTLSKSVPKTPVRKSVVKKVVKTTTN